MHLNPAIQKLLIGKTEEEAISSLQKFKCIWKIAFRDGTNIESTADRDDRRYNLVIEKGVVVKVFAG